MNTRNCIRILIFGNGPRISLGELQLYPDIFNGKAFDVVWRKEGLVCILI